MSSHLLLTATAAVGFLTGLTATIPLLRRLNAARHEARHDPLTGLANRRALTEALTAAARRGQPLAVAMIDLDRFKPINDTFGHDVGDEVLRAIASRLAQLPPPVVLAARLGGDEFVVLIDASTRDTALQAAHAASKTIVATPVRTRAGALAVTASVGVAQHRIGRHPGQLLHDADHAMYLAKRDDEQSVRLHIGAAERIPEPRPRLRRRDRRPDR